MRLPRRPHLPSAKDVTETGWAVVLALRYSGLQLRDSAGLQRSFNVAPASPLCPLIREKGSHSQIGVEFLEPSSESRVLLEDFIAFLVHADPD